MKIPFSIDEFLDVFECYNLSVWPVQIILNLFAIVACFAVLKNSKQVNRIVFSILSFLWLWMGLVYHIIFFSPINPAAKVFGALFIVQSLLFLYSGVIKSNLELKFNTSWVGVLGLILIGYSVIIYPILGYMWGHSYPNSPTFGVPCPTTIFTFGLLLYSVHRVPWYILIIPLLWSVVGFSAALNLHILEDFGLVLAGLLATTIILFIKPKQTIKG
jgi:hypothetical protein